MCYKLQVEIFFSTSKLITNLIFDYSNIKKMEDVTLQKVKNVVFKSHIETNFTRYSHSTQAMALRQAIVLYLSSILKRLDSAY